MEKEIQLSADFHAHFRAVLRFLGVVALAGVFGGLCFYLAEPLIDGIQAPASHSEEEESPYIDVYIGRDASGSIDSESYADIETEIFDHLRIQDGDRVSYFQFGAKTFPEMILPPSPDGTALENVRTARFPSELRGRTNFKEVFERISDSIARNRDASSKRGEIPRRDVVVIISDGVPDADNRNHRCPENDEPFIPEDVRWAYYELVNRKFGSEEDLKVVMLLVGGDVACSPSIKEGWIDLFRAEDLVLSYAEVTEEPGLDLALFEQIDRDRCVYLTPLSRTLSDSSRSSLDHGKPFSIPYKAFSRLKGGRLKVHSGILKDEADRIIGEFAVSSGEDAPRTADIDSVWLPVESPDHGKLRSAAFAVTIFFHFTSRRTAPEVEPLVAYKMYLNATSDIGEVEAGEVLVMPSRLTLQKEDVKRRLHNVSWSFAALFFCYLSLFLLFAFRKPLRPLLRERGEKIVHAIFVDGFRVWVVISVFLLVAMSVVWSLLLPHLVGGICVVASILVWISLRLYHHDNVATKYPGLTRALILKGEFLLLPLLSEVAGSLLSSLL